MKVEQIYIGCFVEVVYYIESDGEAVIIDLLCEIKFYFDKLCQEGVELKYIFEIYFYVDFVFGYIDLVKKIGVIIVYGLKVEMIFEKYMVVDGEEIKLGKLIIKVFYIFGYILESIIFLFIDENGKEYSIFIGDIFFIGDVGCFDLVQKIGEIIIEDFVGWFFDSFCGKIMILFDEVIVYLGYGVGFVCGKNMSDEIWDMFGN